MLITNRNYTKVSRELSPKKIFLFVEGLKREVDYFKMFETNSKIEVVINVLGDGDSNTAIGLYNSAKRVLKSEKSTNIYDSQNDYIEHDFDDEIDEVWIIVDADINRDKITEAQNKCSKEDNWNLVLSNPCFEVWLYYHFSDIKLTFEMLNEKEIAKPIDKCTAWKRYIPKMHSGGFNSREHVSLINSAIINAERNYKEIDNIPNVASTQVFRLAKNICQLIQEKKGKKVN